jgi:ATP synthase protein I
MNDRNIRAAQGADDSSRALKRDPTKSWAEEDMEARQAPFKVLSRAEVMALRDKTGPVSPWWVLAVQAVVGVSMAALAWLLTGNPAVAMSALLGAGIVVLPGALLARGMTSRMSSLSAGVGAVSFMSWEFAKIGTSVAMLFLAPKIVQPLSWPALLVTMVVCMQMYWLALLWRGRK